VGAQIIGMTSFPEYALAREAGLCFVPCSFVTDYDCWDDAIPHVTLAEVIDCMRRNNSKALALALRILKETRPAQGCRCGDSGLKTGLMTPLEAISPEKRKQLAVILGS
jgi:5'-methylthioadenosine phosphorylase